MWVQFFCTNISTFTYRQIYLSDMSKKSHTFKSSTKGACDSFVLAKTRFQHSRGQAPCTTCGHTQDDHSESAGGFGGEVARQAQERSTKHQEHLPFTLPCAIVPTKTGASAFSKAFSFVGPDAHRVQHVLQQTLTDAVDGTSASAGSLFPATTINHSTQSGRLVRGSMASQGSADVSRAPPALVYSDTSSFPLAGRKQPAMFIAPQRNLGRSVLSGERRIAAEASTGRVASLLTPVMQTRAAFDEPPSIQPAPPSMEFVNSPKPNRGGGFRDKKALALKQRFGLDSDGISADQLARCDMVCIKLSTIKCSKVTTFRISCFQDAWG